MKVKTSELTGAALDWAVCLVQGMQPVLADDKGRLFAQVGTTVHAPSRNWAQGGPIVERGQITIRPVFRAGRSESGVEVYTQEGWAAYVEPKAFWVTPRPYAGPTPLIAAMRCYVASKLGDEVEVPDGLC